jgi:ribonuclease PH
VGIWQGVPVLDLDYPEDSNAQTDMNVVAVASGGFVEIQGTAEQESFSDAELVSMLALARKGTRELFDLQQQALKD